MLEHRAIDCIKLVFWIGVDFDQLPIGAIDLFCFDDKHAMADVGAIGLCEVGVPAFTIWAIELVKLGSPHINACRPDRLGLCVGKLSDRFRFP